MIKVTSGEQKYNLWEVRQVMMSNAPILVLSTTGSSDLADSIFASMQTRLGTIDRGRTVVNRYSNENLEVQVPEVRGRNVVVIQTQVTSVNDNLMELLALLHAVKNSSPAQVILVFPYMPYARSDRKNKPRLSVMGVLIPQIITTHLMRKIDKVLLLDPHCPQTKQYFDPFAEEVTAMYLFADHIINGVIKEQGRENCTLVFADAGSVVRYERLSGLLGISTSYIDKSRCDDDENPEINCVVGDVRDKNCILIDDEILTGSTAIKDAERLMTGGARSVCLYAVHPVLADRKTGPKAVVQRFAESPIVKIVVTDSIPVHHKIKETDKFEIVSVVPLLAEAIMRIITSASISGLYKMETVSLYRDA